jgi:Outer membrane protein beta-barrel domain
MKKITIALFVLFTTSAGFAQKRFDEMGERFFRFGVKAGLNIDKMNGKSFREAFGYSYQLGGFMQFNFSRRFGLQPELIFSQSTAEFTNDDTEIYDDLFHGGQQVKARMNYIKVPLLLNINIGPSKRAKLQLGPQWGGLVKSVVDSLVNKNTSLFRKSDFSAVGGLWLQFPVFHIGGRYELGLSNINDIDNREKWRRQTFVVFAGLTF